MTRGARRATRPPWRSPGSAIAAAAIVASCGGPAEPPRAATPAPKSAAAGGGRAAGVAMVTPSRLVPDIRDDRGLVGAEEGQRRMLVDRMRIIARDDGGIERASELFAPGNVRAIDLPDRLGGGYLFFATNAGGTQLWRAATWLGPLEPVVALSSIAEEVVPGFDRLYIRLSSNSRLVSVDPETGDATSLAPLPASASYGSIAFADGWRAALVADLRGTLATFDAGATWRPVPIAEPVVAIDAERGYPRVFVASGAYVIDARGALTFRPGERAPAEVPRFAGLGGPRPDPAAEPGVIGEDDLPSRPAPGPLGPRPLRAAVEDGWPDGDASAVVARNGSLYRVDLATGAITATKEDAYPRAEGRCHAIRVGPGFGFLCGAPDAGTTVHAFEAPLAMRPILRFVTPRFVSPSDNGALVIRGGCADAASPIDGTRAYCIRSAGGATREIRARGRAEDLGTERVVALADGRVIVLVPPGPEGTGQLTIVTGQVAKAVPLALPDRPAQLATAVRSGLWLEGFQEREPGVIGGWVEAGGPVIGLRVSLDGKVTAGDLREDAGGAVLSGRFALSHGDNGTAAESIDGGATWRELELPDTGDDPAAFPVRACGPVGCGLRGWVRVGWGEPATRDDLGPAPTPKPLYLPMRASQALTLRCAPVAQAAPPPREPAKVAPARARPAQPGTLAKPTDRGSWLRFRDAPSPPLATDEVGFDAGGTYDSVAMRAYAWGQRGADWSRAGRWLVRFDDPFDAAGGVRSTAPSASPWTDEVSAAEQLGASTRGSSWAWSAELDPSGRAALVSACRGGACALFAAADGQSITPLRDATGKAGAVFRSLSPDGAVRLGETWYFLLGSVGSTTPSLDLYRLELGVGRLVARYPRASVQSVVQAPRLVRRASGSGLGLLVSASLEPGARQDRGDLYVMPIDTETFELGDALSLGRRDLAGTRVSACAPHQDGWTLDTKMDAGPVIQLASGRAVFDGIELRLRLDPGAACIEAAAARTDGLPEPAKGAARATSTPSGTSFPLAATERASGRRRTMRCELPGKP